MAEETEPPKEGTVGHRQWYMANEARAADIKEKLSMGMKLGPKDEQWLGWWEQYVKDNPKPDVFPKHSTMTVKRDMDPME